MKTFWTKNILLNILLIALYGISLYLNYKITTPNILYTFFDKYLFIFYPLLAFLSLLFAIVALIIRKRKNADNTNATLAITICSLGFTCSILITGFLWMMIGIGR